MLLKQKKAILAWLDKYQVENYTLIPDSQYGYVVDVEGNVELSNKNLSQIEVKFNQVSDSFYCLYNSLTSLEGSPLSLGGYFLCNQNRLTSLEYCPSSVGGNFSCSHNQITSLDYLPTSVGEDFFCNNNPLPFKYWDINDLAQLKVIINADREDALLSSALQSANLPKNILKV